MLIEATRQFFVKHGIEPCRVVVAVSGGVDSTALLLALAELRPAGFEIVCAHVNHHLRGADSDADQQFVRELCARLGVDLRVADGSLPTTRGLGLEGAARAVRYARLLAIRDEAGAKYIATAHQKNDQAETVLMRLLTGGGVAGLRGIHPVREDGVIRPLLEVTRDTIETFVRDRGVTARIDRSNDDPRFLRNRVRALLREMGGVENIASIAEQARLLWPHVERAIDAVEDVEITPDSTRFRSWPDDAWLLQALLHRHIRRLDPGAREVSAADLQRLAGERPKRVSVTKSLELVGDVLRRRVTPTAEFEIELTREAPIPELGVTVHVAPSSVVPPTPAVRAAEVGGATQGGATQKRQRFQLPTGAEPRFLVRNRRRGDRFQPLGLAAPKKLNEFLIDRKIAAELRDSLPLLIWNGEIVWVAGVEVSERFKVTSPPGEGTYEVWLEASGAFDRDQAGPQR